MGINKYLDEVENDFWIFGMVNGKNLKKELTTPHFWSDENRYDMKTINELNEKKIPIIKIDNSLEKYIDMPIFQDKVDKANEMLRTIGLPKHTTK